MCAAHGKKRLPAPFGKAALLSGRPRSIGLSLAGSRGFLIRKGCRFKPMEKPSIEILRKLLSYDPFTGILTWKLRPIEFFAEDAKHSQKHNAAAWNARYAGTQFGTLNDGGYLHGQIFKTPHKASHVAWALETGEWPKDKIDHENHIRTDNRFENLKEVTSAQNSKNQKLFKTNTSGTVGVKWCKRNKKWLAQIRVSQRTKHLGYFKEKADAIAARKKSEIEHEFHPNHGLSLPQSLSAARKAP